MLEYVFRKKTNKRTGRQTQYQWIRAGHHVHNRCYRALPAVWVYNLVIFLSLSFNFHNNLDVLKLIQIKIKNWLKKLTHVYTFNETVYFGNNNFFNINIINCYAICCMRNCFVRFRGENFNNSDTNLNALITYKF